MRRLLLAPMVLLIAGCGSHVETTLQSCMTQGYPGILIGNKYYNPTVSCADGSIGPSGKYHSSHGDKPTSRYTYLEIRRPSEPKNIVRNPKASRPLR